MSFIKKLIKLIVKLCILKIRNKIILLSKVVLDESCAKEIKEFIDSKAEIIINNILVINI
jgi:hypothetical protein